MLQRAAGWGWYLPDECSVHLQSYYKLSYDEIGKSAPLKGQQKHPTKAHDWESISTRGTIPIFLFTDTMTAIKYVDILNAGLLPFIKSCPRAELSKMWTQASEKEGAKPCEKEGAELSTTQGAEQPETQSQASEKEGAKPSEKLSDTQGDEQSETQLQASGKERAKPSEKEGPELSEKEGAEHCPKRMELSCPSHNSRLLRGRELIWVERALCLKRTICLQDSFSRSEISASTPLQVWFYMCTNRHWKRP